MFEQSRETEILKSIIDDTEYNKTPQSRNEEILVSILNDTEYTKTPQSREEELLLQLKDVIEDGKVIKHVSGNPIEFSDGSNAPLVKCVTAIQGNQDLHGYDKPWVGGAGKNKLNADGIVITYNPNNYNQNIQNPISIVEGKTYTISAYQDKSISSATRNTLSVNYNGRSFYETISENYHLESGRHTFTFTSDFTGIAYVGIWMHTPSDTSLTYSKFMVEEGSTATAFTPYSNICPITAYSQSTISVEDENEVVQQTSTATFSNSIYQGNADFVGRSATADLIAIDLGDLPWVYNATNAYFAAELPEMKDYNYDITPSWKCSIYEIGPTRYSTNAGSSANYTIFPRTSSKYVFVKDTRYTSASDLITALSGEKLVIDVENPITETITPTNLPIKSLFGYNHIESSTGDMEIEYIKKDYQKFVDTVEKALPNTRKGGIKAIDIFKSLVIDDEKEFVK